MSLSYCPADLTDIPQIFSQAKQLIDAYEDTDAIDYEKVLAWVKRKVETQIGSYRRVHLNGEKAAYFRLCQDGELDDLYVLPPYRNRGIGSEILKKCIEESEKPLYLYVFSRNTRAISLYERFGFCTAEYVGNTRQIMKRQG